MAHLKRQKTIGCTCSKTCCTTPNKNLTLLLIANVMSTELCISLSLFISNSISINHSKIPEISLRKKRTTRRMTTYSFCHGMVIRWNPLHTSHSTAHDPNISHSTPPTKIHRSTKKKINWQNSKNIESVVFRPSVCLSFMIDWIVPSAYIQHDNGWYRLWWNSSPSQITSVVCHRTSFLLHLS